jgi:hypothetical protein
MHQGALAPGRDTQQVHLSHRSYSQIQTEALVERHHLRIYCALCTIYKLNWPLSPRDPLPPAGGFQGSNKRRTQRVRNMLRKRFETSLGGKTVKKKGGGPNPEMSMFSAPYANAFYASALPGTPPGTPRVTTRRKTPGCVRIILRM